jgi:hypothetical protein
MFRRPEAVGTVSWTAEKAGKSLGYYEFSSSRIARQGEDDQ